MRQTAILTALTFIVLPGVGAAGCSARDDRHTPHESHAAQAPPAATKPMVPVTVQTLPDATCTLRSEGVTKTDAEHVLSVYADEDGLARFVAVRGAPGDGVADLLLDCQTDHDTRSHRVDLHAAATFEPVTAVPSPSARFRPPLAGDPMGYSRRELLETGYGLRPDPVAQPAIYAVWLEMAKKTLRRHTARLATSESPLIAGQYTTDNTTTGWGGSDVGPIPGSPAITFTTVWSSFTVPQIHPQSFNASGSIWAGLGGHNSPLIQDGVGLNTTTTAGTAYAWIEYVGNGPNAPAYPIQNLAVQPGNGMYVQAWVCDGNGAITVTGGHGCFYIANDTNSEYTECLSPQQPCSPRASTLNLPGSLPAPGTYVGETAEWIVERNNPNPLVKFSPFYMGGSADDSLGGHHDMTTDYNVIGNLVSQNTSTPTLLLEKAFVVQNPGLGQSSTFFLWNAPQ